MDKFLMYEYKIYLRDLQPINLSFLDKLINIHDEKYLNLYYLTYISIQQHTSIFSIEKLFQYNFNLINQICDYYDIQSLSTGDKNILSLCMCPSCFGSSMFEQIDFYNNIIDNYIPADEYLEYFLYTIKYHLLDINAEASNNDNYFEKFKILFFELKNNKENYNNLINKIVGRLVTYDKKN